MYEYQYWTIVFYQVQITRCIFHIATVLGQELAPLPLGLRPRDWLTTVTAMRAGPRNDQTTTHVRCHIHDGRVDGFCACMLDDDG